ncbi:MAG: RNA 2'-phosphotransferase [Deltaproteobacteria bacterium]|nr:MAG: RNA 2'-phosphotransferase [Deltaproteobacteria bacterium]
MSHRHRVKALGKLMAYILRHRPDEFGLVPDEEGFVSLKDLQQAISEEEEWRFVKRSDIIEVVITDSKKRFEIRDDRIRATYGHSFSQRITYEQIVPPKILYHGTRRRSYPAILQKGLLPMGRQYVHLTPSRELAERIGRRRDPKPLILEVHAERAHQHGVRFFQAAPLIFLAEHIPPSFVSGPPLERVLEGLRKPKATAVTEPVAEVVHGKQWKKEARKFRKTYKNL